MRESEGENQILPKSSLVSVTFYNIVRKQITKVKTLALTDENPEEFIRLKSLKRL